MATNQDAIDAGKKSRLRIARGTQANLNPVPFPEGTLFYEKDTNLLKIGDGSAVHTTPQQLQEEHGKPLYVRGIASNEVVSDSSVNFFGSIRKNELVYTSDGKLYGSFVFLHLTNNPKDTGTFSSTIDKYGNIQLSSSGKLTASVQGSGSIVKLKDVDITVSGNTVINSEEKVDITVGKGVKLTDTGSLSFNTQDSSTISGSLQKNIKLSTKQIDISASGNISIEQSGTTTIKTTQPINIKNDSGVKFFDYSAGKYDRLHRSSAERDQAFSFPVLNSDSASGDIKNNGILSTDVDIKKGGEIISGNTIFGDIDWKVNGVFHRIRPFGYPTTNGTSGYIFRAANNNGTTEWKTLASLVPSNSANDLFIVGRKGNEVSDIVYNSGFVIKSGNLLQVTNSGIKIGSNGPVIKIQDKYYNTNSANDNNINGLTYNIANPGTSSPYNVIPLTNATTAVPNGTMALTAGASGKSGSAVMQTSILVMDTALIRDKKNASGVAINTNNYFVRVSGKGTSARLSAYNSTLNINTDTNGELLLTRGGTSISGLTDSQKQTYSQTVRSNLRVNKKVSVCWTGISSATTNMPDNERGFTVFPLALLGANGNSSIMTSGRTGANQYGDVVPDKNCELNRLFVYSPSGRSDALGCYITAAGELIAPSFNATSDRKLKTNIEDYKGINRITDVPVRRFNWIVDGKEDVGLIAQELEEKFPQLVTMGANNTKTIKESKLVYYLIHDVALLRKEIEELKRGN